MEFKMQLSKDVTYLHGQMFNTCPIVKVARRIYLPEHKFYLSQADRQALKYICLKADGCFRIKDKI